MHSDSHHLSAPLLGVILVDSVHLNCYCRCYCIFVCHFVDWPISPHQVGVYLVRFSLFKLYSRFSLVSSLRSLMCYVSSSVGFTITSLVYEIALTLSQVYSIALDIHLELEVRSRIDIESYMYVYGN